MADNSGREASTGFNNALGQLIESYTGEVEAETIAAILSEYAEGLGRGSMAPRAMLEGSAEPFTLRLNYPFPAALERALKDFLEVEGFTVELDRAAPPLATLTIALSVDGCEQTIELSGRPVTETPMGTAIHVDPATAQQRAALRALPHAAREARRSAPRPKPAASSQKPAEPAPHQPAPRPASAPKKPQPTQPATPAPKVTSAANSDESAPLEASRWTPMDASSIREALVQVSMRPGAHLVDFRIGADTLQVIVTEGQIRDAHRFPLRDELGLRRALEDADVLTPYQKSQLAEHLQMRGGQISTLLLELELIDKPTLGRVEASRTFETINSVWDRKPDLARSATLRHTPMRCLATPRHALDLCVDLMANRATEQPAAHDYMRKRLKGRSARIANLPFTPDNQAWSDAAHQSIDIFAQKSRTLSESILASRLKEPETVALLWAFDTLGLLHVKTSEAWTRQLTRRVERIELFYSKLGKSDHFDLLGIHWSAFTEEVEEAYQSLRERLETDLANDSLPDEARRKAERFLEAIQDAYKVLSTRASRIAYRKEAIDPYQVRSSVPLFEQQAQTAKIRKEYSEALEFYRRILELKPRHEDAQRQVAALRKIMPGATA